ncbi:membrane protein insertase YidC [Arcobacter sp. KX21116]|jgi:YidC/Oxa1 family membrane protein insertase|uniref:membrane protein insertase YidC n=1 Tax=Arcobacter iocasae TaxID=2906515 RepID=UPI0035D3EB4E|tara:strand:+ start:8748 stop:10394 length:1647 start_codon:yes stop_codon:yes gene_type:complete
MNNLNNNQGMQKRMLIMTLIVFVFFVAYEFLVLKPQKEAQAAKIAQEKIVKANNAPQVAQDSTNPASAPVSNMSTPSNVADAISSKTIATNDIVSTITTDKNIIQIDKLGRIAQVTLLERQYINEDNSHIKLFEPNQLRPLEVRFADKNINNEAFNVEVTVSSPVIDATKQTQTLIITQTLKETVLTKTLTIYTDGHYDLDVKATNNKQFFITPGYRPNVLADMYADHGAIVKLADDTLDVTVDGKSDKTKTYQAVKFLSFFDRYYTTVVYNFKKTMQVSLMPDKDSNPQGFVHSENASIDFSGYIGPKEHKALKALNPQLTGVIEYGWFTFIANPMFLFLQFLQSYVGNWGWTIVFATIIIKLILFPLSYKGMMSMQKLKDLAPKIKELQEKYKGDKQKQSAHMMELYKKHGANPMGGCLPLIMQIPVFFALYRVILNAIELKGSPWILWIHDLALMDPYYVLPILMGISMFLQQKITPNTMQDETQKKIFQFLPVVFTFFFLWFPAGLTLYWFINNLFTISQQFFINKMFEKKKLVEIEEKKASKK